MNKSFNLDEQGFAVGGRARKWQAANDTANLLGPIRAQNKADALVARAAAKVIWQNGMALIRQINAEIEPAKESLYHPAFYPPAEVPAMKQETLKPRKRIMDWGKTLKETSPEVAQARIELAERLARGGTYVN